jgi:hypothetical protein
MREIMKKNLKMKYIYIYIFDVASEQSIINFH